MKIARGTVSRAIESLAGCAPAAFATSLAQNPIARATLLSVNPQRYRQTEHGKTEATIVTHAADQIVGFLNTLGIAVEEVRYKGQTAMLLIFETTQDYVREMWRHLFAYRPPKRKRSRHRGQSGIFKPRGRPTRH